MKTVIKYSIAVWIIFALLITWVIIPFTTPAGAILRVSSLVLLQMVLFYSNLVYLSPQFLDKNKIGKYFSIILILILLYVSTGSLIDIYLDSNFKINGRQWHEDAPFLARPLKLIITLRILTSIPPLIISALISRTILLRKKDKEKLELENKMLAAETKALKAQINPHFLFNSLNNIYSLAQMKSERTPDAILQLSEILRYVTYDASQNLVKLQNEISTIENFINLQKLKDENQDNIEIEIDENWEELKIAPLLLIPFIENSFKHSNFEDKINGWIKISLKIDGLNLALNISNSSGIHSKYKKDTTGGVGMENVQKRLDLLYPNRHELSIKQTQSTYSVDFKIQLEK